MLLYNRLSKYPANGRTQGGRRNWTVNYIGTPSLSFLLAQIFIGWLQTSSLMKIRVISFIVMGNLYQFNAHCLIVHWGKNNLFSIALSLNP